MGAERLQKILAAAGVASRRASESLIEAGRVTVDGRVARIGDRVDADTVRIEVDGRPISAASAPIHLAVHKPAGVISTVRDPHADRTVLQLLPTAVLQPGGRIYPVGRLDRDSEGLLLLTNDGPWAERILHPRFGLDREYAVALGAWLTNEQRRTLDAGVALEEGQASFAHPVRPASTAEIVDLAGLLRPPPAAGLVWYRVVLRQGWKRQVRRMFGAAGVPVVRLVRVRIGRVRLDGLRSGRFRRLRGPEIRALGASEPSDPSRPSVPAKRKPSRAPAQPGVQSAAGRTRPAAGPSEPAGRRGRARRPG